MGIDPIEAVRDFFASGGLVLWAIAGVAFLLWTLILERSWFYLFTFPAQAKAIKEQWERRSDKTSWYAHRIREMFLGRAKVRLEHNLSLIKVLIALCPLFGLLGTVTGMIEVFDVMAAMGTGNARAMASGVSMATIPTMAGMVVALAGLLFEMRLEQVSKQSVRALSQHLETTKGA